MKPSVIICLFNHGTGQPHAEYCPTCLKIACADRNAEIAALNQLCGGYKQRLAKAYKFIERTGTVGADSVEYIEAAKRWLEEKP